MAVPTSIEQYLNTSYRPDVEFIEGDLRERSATPWSHSRLLTLAGSWFGRHEEEWDILTGLNARIRVSLSRVRLADLVIVVPAAYPPTLVEPPLVVVEIISPTDSYSEIDERMRDYATMGVPNLWIIDPQQRIARERREGTWVDVTRLSVPESPIYVGVPRLFARLDRYGPSA